jgi:hypothetical protein
MVPPVVASSAGTATPSFELQPETICDHGNINVVGTVWLKFGHPVVEEDFLRFVMRGRNVQLLLVFAAFAAWGGSRLGIAPDLIIAAVHGAQTCFAAAAFALYVAVVVVPGCSDDRSLALSSTLAARAERLATVFCAVSGFIESGLIPYEAVAVCAATGGDGWCHYYSITVPISLMAFVALFVRPRVTHSTSACALVSIGFLGGSVPVGVYRPVDYAAAILLMLTALVVVSIEAMGVERRERRHFVDHVRLIRAEEKLASMMTHTKEILRSAMPPELLNDDMTLAATTHRSDCATVGMSDIYDFAQWSCGLLVENVVLNLHMLLTMCDVAAVEHGVVRAMTYGDCYVVCGGLIEPGGNHAQAVLAFEQWLARASAGAWQQFESPLAIRASVCTGPLVGQIAGEASLRYIVSGAALDVARDAVARAVGNDVVLCDDVVLPLRRGESRNEPLTVASLAHSHPVSAASEHVSEPSADAIDVVQRSLDRGSGAESSANTFSALWLAFETPAARVGFAEFVAETEADVARFVAVLPPCVFGAFLLVMLLEFASPDPRRHHHDNLLAIGGLAAATAAGILVFVARARNLQVHVAVLYTATAAALSVGTVSLVFADCVFARPQWYVALLLGLPGIFLRLPWLAQTALQFSTIFVPIAAFFALEYANASDDVAFSAVNVVAVFVFITWAFIAARYFSARAACRQYVAASCAAVAVHAAVSRAAQQDRLLRGLLPPHAVQHTRAIAVPGDEPLHVDLGLQVPVDLVAPTYIAKSPGLSALQVSVHTWRTAAGRPVMADVWRHVTAALDDVGGLLEMVQATGDNFLVAGPFTSRGPQALPEIERRRQLAAQAAVLLAGDVARRVGGVCRFTAVLTAGSASGALLGASLLSFRLVGPIVRESNALLAAAPQTTEKSVLFASAGFRQQHRNFVTPRSAAVDAAMSTGRRMSHTDATVDSPRPASAAKATQAALVDAETFGEGSRWRVRGVGVAVVHQVVLSVPAKLPQ